MFYVKKTMRAEVQLLLSDPVTQIMPDGTLVTKNIQEKLKLNFQPISPEYLVELINGIFKDTTPLLHFLVDVVENPEEAYLYSNQTHKVWVGKGKLTGKLFYLNL